MARWTAGGASVCDRRRNPKQQIFNSANIVARLNLPNMAYSPEYRDSKILAGIGALVVKDNVGRYAERRPMHSKTGPMINCGKP
jgi:hypothetical protein